MDGVKIAVESDEVVLRLSSDRAEQLVSALQMVEYTANELVPVLKTIKTPTHDPNQLASTDSVDLAVHLVDKINDAMMAIAIGGI